MDKQFILDEIRRTAEENGGQPLGRERFQKSTGIRESDWSGRHWVRWSEAIAEAGFTNNRFQQRHDDELQLQQVALLTRRLGHFPVTAELLMERRSNDEFPHQRTLTVKFGNMAGVVDALSTFCVEHEEFADVIPLLPAQENQESDEVEVQPTTAFGSVYLIKSGRFFKIGRSNSVGRREREIALQLPEVSRTVHVITTDDPPGIENYWHRRFADKRRNGEWFDLSAADVSAFKRRKFM